METDKEIKQAMRSRYDAIGERVGISIEKLTEDHAIWRSVEGSTPALAYYRRRKIQTALALGNFRPGSAILDVGCGTGDYTCLLARMGFRMTGLDLSPVSIETARMKAERLHLGATFVVADAESLENMPEGSFEGVVSFSALRYVPRIERALASIARVLKSRGRAVLDFPNRYCPWFSVLKVPLRVERHPYDHLYSAGQVASLLRAAGLTEVTTRHVLYTPYQTPTFLLDLFRLADVVGERTPLLNRTAAIIFGAGMKP